MVHDVGPVVTAPTRPGPGGPVVRLVAVAVATALLLVAGAACGTTPRPDGEGAAAVTLPGDVPSSALADGAPGRDEEARSASPRVAVVGDSTAERLAPAIGSWADDTDALVYVGNAARLGCPLGRGGTMHTAADVTGPVNEDCDWEAVATTGLDGVVRPTFADVATRWEPDLVVVSNGVWDVADRQLPGRSTWQHAGDAEYDTWLLAELVAANDELSAGGAQVVWLTASPWEGATRNPPEQLYAPAADPARVVAYNRILERVAAARPDAASVVDLAGWLAVTGDDARLRPDGAHFEVDTAVEVLDRYLGQALLDRWAASAGDR